MLEHFDHSTDLSGHLHFDIQALESLGLETPAQGVCFAIAQIGAQEAYLHSQGLPSTGFFEGLNALVKNPMIGDLLAGKPIDSDHVDDFFKENPHCMDFFGSKTDNLSVKALCPEGLVSPVIRKLVDQGEYKKALKQLVSDMDSGNKTVRENAQKALQHFIEKQAFSLASDIMFLATPGSVLDTPAQPWFINTSLKSIGTIANQYTQEALAKDLEQCPPGTLCGIGIPGHAVSAVRLPDGDWAFTDVNNWPIRHDGHFEKLTTDELAAAILSSHGVENDAGFVALSLFMDPSSVNVPPTPLTSLSEIRIDTENAPRLMKSLSPDSWVALLSQHPDLLPAPETLAHMLPLIKSDMLYATLAHIPSHDHIAATLSASIRESTEPSPITQRNRTVLFAEIVRRHQANPIECTNANDVLDAIRQEPLASLKAQAKEIVGPSDWQIHVLEQRLPPDSKVHGMVQSMRLDTRGLLEGGQHSTQKVDTAWWIAEHADALESILQQDPSSHIAAIKEKFGDTLESKRFIAMYKAYMQNA